MLNFNHHFKKRVFSWKLTVKPFGSVAVTFTPSFKDEVLFTKYFLPLPCRRMFLRRNIVSAALHILGKFLWTTKRQMDVNMQSNLNVLHWFLSQILQTKCFTLTWEVKTILSTQHFCYLTFFRHNCNALLSVSDKYFLKGRKIT